MNLDLASILQGQVFAYLLIFCRTGTIFMLMPGLGESFVPQRIRLQFALLVAFILLPILAPSLPPMPQSATKLAEAIFSEFGIGLFIGLTMRLIFSTLEVVGMLISTQIGLSNASIFNPTMQSQSSLPGAMMGLLGIIVLFESGLFEMMIGGLSQSYGLFHAAQPLPIADMTHFMTNTITDSMNLSLRLVAPFMVLGIVFQLIAGIMVKMVPQMQIFFVAAPLQIILGLVMFAATLGGIMTFWAQEYEATLSKLFGGG